MNDKHIRPVNILIVEDNPGDVELVLEALESGKVHNSISVVRDGEAALDFLYRRDPHTNAERPDLIFLDLNLPKKDGREVLSTVKEDTILRRIPVVVMTTSAAEEDVLRSYDLHANCYITKPLDIKKFFEVVRTIESFWMSVVVLPEEENGS